MGLYDLEDPEEIQAFQELDHMNPRAMGIVAGAIVERRLTAVIQSRMRTPANAKERELLKSLFKPSGALGTFNAKIAVAYLLGFQHSGQYKDLMHIKEIRNRFAHDISCHDFEDNEIRNRVNNMTSLAIIKSHFAEGPAKYKGKEWSLTSIRDKFHITVQFILWSLMRDLQESGEAPPSP